MIYPRPDGKSPYTVVALDNYGTRQMVARVWARDAAEAAREHPGKVKTVFQEHLRPAFPTLENDEEE